MTKLRIVEDDILTYFISPTASGWCDYEPEFTEQEAARIQAGQDEWDAIQALIFHRINGHPRGAYQDEDQT